jgi:hypothetical protein
MQPGRKTSPSIGAAVGKKLTRNDTDVATEQASPRHQAAPLPTDFVQFLSDERGISREEALILLSEYIVGLRRPKQR